MLIDYKLNISSYAYIYHYTKSQFLDVSVIRKYLVTERTVLKNKVHALLAKYEYQCPVSHISQIKAQNDSKP